MVTVRCTSAVMARRFAYSGSGTPYSPTQHGLYAAEWQANPGFQLGGIQCAGRPGVASGRVTTNKTQRGYPAMVRRLDGYTGNVSMPWNRISTGSPIQTNEWASPMTSHQYAKWCGGGHAA